MKLEDQVVSLELAKNLKELGVKQESLFYWVADIEKLMKERGEDIMPERCRCIHSVAELPTDTGEKFHPEIDLRFYDKAKPVGREAYAAYTVAELGEMLPDFLPGNFNWLSRGRKNWVAYERSGLTLHVVDTADTEADTRAKMLIYLIENNLIEK